VDRYSAYKAMAKRLAIILACCWAHVRRDFLGLAKDWPPLASWALAWVRAIGELYHLNHLRLEALEQPELLAQRDQTLREAIDRMEKTRQDQQKDPDLHTAQAKALQSLEEHWKGLTVFVDHPEVPMDNNKAERGERTPVIARNHPQLPALEYVPGTTPSVLHFSKAQRHLVTTDQEAACDRKR